MSANIATIFTDQMTNLTGNVGGAVQTLDNVNKVGYKERGFVSLLTLASQASGSVIAVARIPVPFVFLGITLVSSVSLGSSTLVFGSPGNFSGSQNFYGISSTLTTASLPQGIAAAATFGQEIDTGYDSTTGLATTYGQSSGFGGQYEDIVMTVGAASLPSSGSLYIAVKYAID